MSKKSNYNSIVFLTTLGVYLGLVLVGGAGSPVLAQAALTRDFDIRNEIEYKDDLDKKPDEDLFVSQISSLVDEINEFSKKALFDWSAKNEFAIEGLGFCESDDSPSFLGSGTIDRRVDAALEKRAIEISRRFFNRLSVLGLGDVYSHGADFNFALTERSLNIKIAVGAPHYPDTEKDIRPLADELTAYLARISSSAKPTKERIVAENTKVSFRDNQIFLVTHLPRASIDDFLDR